MRNARPSNTEETFPYTWLHAGGEWQSGSVHKEFHIVLPLFVKVMFRVVYCIVVCFCPCVPVHQETPGQNRQRYSRLWQENIKFTVNSPQFSCALIDCFVPLLLRRKDQFALLFYIQKLNS